MYPMEQTNKCIPNSTTRSVEHTNEAKINIRKGG